MNERSNSKEKSRSWLVRFIFLLSFAVFVLVAPAFSKELMRKRQVQKEIDDLRVQAEKIRKDNLELESKIAYLSSKDYQEKEAKDKLNLQGPGENVVIVNQNTAAKQDDFKETAKTEAASNAKDTPNYRKWWDYFFKY